MKFTDPVRDERYEMTPEHTEPVKSNNTYSMAQINFARPVDDPDDRYMLEENMSEGVSQLPQKVEVQGGEQGWSQDGTSYSFVVMSGEEPTLDDARNALGWDEYSDGAPEITSVDIPLKDAVGEPVDVGSKKGGLPSASRGIPTGMENPVKASARCGKPVKYNGQPCILVPGHGGNCRSR